MSIVDFLKSKIYGLNDMTTTFDNATVEITAKLSILIGTPPDRITHSRLITWSITEDDHFITFLVDQKHIIYKVPAEVGCRLTVEQFLILMAIIQSYKLQYIEEMVDDEISQLTTVVDYCLSGGLDNE